MAPMLRPLLLALVALALAPALSACTAAFFVPDREVRISPADAGLAYRDVTFATADGVRLHGWFLPAAASEAGRSQEESQRESQNANGATACTVLFLHGNAQNIGAHLASVYWLPARGINVFLFDYRGYGRSDGVPTLDGLHRDVAAAFDTLLAMDAVGPGKSVVLFGQSLGGAVAVTALARSPHRDRVAALVVEGAFAGYRRIAREKLAELWLTWPLQAPLSRTVDDSYRPLEAAAGIAPVPLLVVHGLADRTVPPQHGRDLFAAAAEPKDLWLLPGVRHIAAFTDEANRDRLVDYLSGCDPNNK